MATPTAFTANFKPLVSRLASPTLPTWSAVLLYILSAQLPISAPPTSLGECFFNSLVVGVPCSLIFWQCLLFIVFRLVVILLVMQGSKAFLPTSPSWPELCFLYLFIRFITEFILNKCILNERSSLYVRFCSQIMQLVIYMRR